jgi:hypothetical protein
MTDPRHAPYSFRGGLLWSFWELAKFSLPIRPKKPTPACGFASIGQRDSTMDRRARHREHRMHGKTVLTNAYKKGEISYWLLPAPGSIVALSGIHRNMRFRFILPSPLSGTQYHPPALSSFLAGVAF